jgi:ABC-2 type transport system permease protein
MRRIYLIARREYLAYVTAWGFWLSLILVPFFMSIGFLGPLLAQQASPMRYYAVIASDPALDAAYEAGLQRAARSAYEGAVRATARVRGGDADAERRALAAFNEHDDPREGLAAATETLGLPANASVSAGSFKFERVDPPATDPDALRPYLLGEATVDTPEGPKPLHAAIFLRRDADGGVAIDYWSTALTDNALLNVAQRAMQEYVREEAFRAAGISAEAVARVDALEPRVTELNPVRTGGAAEVTIADRLPIFVGLGLGLVLWIVIFSVVNILLSSTIEEKGNKILEALLASARYHEILIGKLIGVAGVSATLLGFWGLFGVAGLTAVTSAGLPLPPEVLTTLSDPGLLIPFVGYFVLGYLMYGAIFLAIGSLCETIQEAQTLMTPMIFVLMGPMILLPVVLRAPDASLVAILSWVPLYTPFLMMVRLPSDPPLYQVIGTSITLALSTLLILWAAGGVFRAGVVGQAGPDFFKRALGRLTRRGGGAADPEPGAAKP